MLQHFAEKETISRRLRDTTNYGILEYQRIMNNGVPQGATLFPTSLSLLVHGLPTLDRCQSNKCSLYRQYETRYGVVITTSVTVLYSILEILCGYMLYSNVVITWVVVMFIPIISALHGNTTRAGFYEESFGCDGARGGNHIYLTLTRCTMHQVLQWIFSGSHFNRGMRDLRVTTGLDSWPEATP